jgi:peptidoglycan/xylan/chitin deacetylase (PgdA/CDA1 family)
MSAFLPLLTFHTLGDEQSVTAFSPDVFARGMQRLHDSGYRTLTLLDAVDAVRRRTGFPERAFVLTFDDGYRTVYESAFPVLQRHGMSATIFLTVGHERSGPGGRLPAFEGRTMLSWHEIREMQQAGMTFGAHTCTHPDLTRLPAHEVQAEVRDSKAVIEDALGVPVSCFAYPYGRYDRRVAEIVRLHFLCACSDRLGLVTARSDPHTLERVDAYYLRSSGRFDLMLTSVFPWYVRMHSVPRRLRRACRLA